MKKIKANRAITLTIVITILVSIFTQSIFTQTLYALEDNTIPIGPRAVFGGEFGTELFLGGNYIELGISNWGDFGTMGTKPTNFRGTMGGETTGGSNHIGMSADHDGYNYGRDLPVDYYLPGTPEERFAVGYKVGLISYSKSNSAQMNSKQMITTVENLSDINTGLLKAKTVSVWTGTMEVTQVISFNTNDKFYRNEVTLKNISSQNWDGARYMRSFDPDNTQFRGGLYETKNIVTHTVAEDRKAVVKAETFGDTDPLYQAFGTRSPIFFYSNDSRAVASVFGFTNVSPYDSSAYEVPSAKGKTVSADVAITMTWDSGELSPNESKTFIYYTSLDERDFDDVQGEIVIADIEKDIEDVEDMDDVKEVKDKIDKETDLKEDKKKEFKGILADDICDYPGPKDIPIRNDEDIKLVKALIDESDKTNEEKDDIRGKLVVKAIRDITDLKDKDKEKEKEAIKDVIDDITDVEKKAGAQSNLDLVGLVDVAAIELAVAKNNAALKEDAEYTIVSWKVLTDALALPETTDAEKIAKTTAINDAITVLVLKADLTNYNLALVEVTEANYTEASWTAYQLVVTENVVTVENTQAEVNAATSAITTAQSNLVTKVDANLATAKNNATAKEESEYTIISWKVLTDALALSETTDAEKIAKTTAINDAITALVEKADLTNYNLALGAVIEANYTEASWTAYQLIVDANVVTVENTQAEVNTATLVITTAQSNLVTKVDANLGLAKDNATLKVEANYTIVSWKVLTDALALPETTDAEKIAKTVAINDAITVLVLKADLTNYNLALVEVTEANYTEASWTAYQLVVTENVVTVENTQAEVNVATLAITAAQSSLITKVDANLATAKNNATAKEEAEYTIISWKVLTDALALSETTDAEKIAKTVAINDAITVLVLKADLTNYNLALVEVTEANYTEASWTAYQLIVDANVVTVENTQAEVNTATSAIAMAQSSLVTKVDANLGLAKDNAALKIESDYTIMSWKVLTDALALPETTDAEKIAKTTAINDAITVLVEKADLTNYNLALVAVTEANYTEASWTAYQLVVTENVVTVENTQAEVDAATLAITTAQSSLVTKVDANLATAKTNAKSELGSYVDAEEYTVNASTLASAISTGKTNIDEAINLAGVATALENAKTVIDLIESDAEIATRELQEAKTAVTTAETSKTDETRTAAQTLVSALPEGAEKIALQGRINLIVAAKDKAEADQEAARTVNAKITELPIAGAVVIGNKDQIEVARLAYEALTEDQKTLVNIATLETAEAELVVLENLSAELQSAKVAVAAAKTKAEDVVYSGMTQVTAKDEVAIANAVKATAITAVGDNSVTVTINKISYSAPTVGTLENPSGTNGSYIFTVTVNKGTQIETTEQKTIIITAKLYETIPTYEIAGAVKDTESNSVKGADVKIVRGQNQVGLSVQTDAQGKFTIINVVSGTYNLVVSKSGIIVTSMIKVNGDNYAAGTIILPVGKTNSVVEVKPSAPEVVVGNLDMQFLNTVTGNDKGVTAEDRMVVAAGGSIEIKLSVEKIDISEGNARDIENTATSNGNTVGIFIDLSVSKTVNDSSGAKITTQSAILTQLPNLIDVYIPLPTEHQGKSNYFVYRYHGSDVDIITTTANEDGEMIELVDNSKAIKLTVKKFSTYAIAYTTPTPPKSDKRKDVEVISTITPEQDKDGKIIIRDDKKTVDIISDNGYVIADVIVDGKSTGAIEKYTFTDSNNHKISAVFVKESELPYYLQNGEKVYIGFSTIAGNIYKYIAPISETIKFRDNSKNFTDNTIDWAKPSIDFVTERELFLGTSQNKFSPNDGMTRAMFVTVIGRLYERSYENISGISTFYDVDVNAYYGKYVAWANEKGLIKGIGENKFAPDNKVTREQMAAIMLNFARFLNTAEIADSSLVYVDSANISSWAIDGAKFCQETKVITGRENGNFVPQGNATRAEVAVVIERFIKIIVK